MALEKLTNPEISYLAQELSEKFNLSMQEVGQRILEIVLSLEEEQYRPMGYRGSWMDNDNQQLDD